jgi:hypothetical protein
MTSAYNAGVKAGIERKRRKPTAQDKSQLLGFLKSKKGKVTDQQFHAFAEGLGLDKNKAEEAIYQEIGKTAAKKKQKMVVKLSYPVFHRMWQDLEHSADCAHPECDRCAKIARSLEDGTRSYSHSLELLGMIPGSS